MARVYYLPALVILNMLILFFSWPGVFLAVIIMMTYLTFPPDRVFHPANMLFAYYGLYVVVSCGLNFILSIIGWDYQLPWGQIVFWDTFSRYTIYQIELTFLVLYFGLSKFSKPVGMPVRTAPPATLVRHPPDLFPAVSPTVVYATVAIAILFVAWFIQVTAGLNEWLFNYSETYLSRREGFGLLNVVTAAIGSAAMFLLGILTYQSRRKRELLFLSFATLIILSFPAGFKSRLIFLIIMFLSPWMLQIKFSLKWLWRLGVSFIVLLYLATLVRTQGFYASPPFFMEMLIGYFNSYQLHDWVVTSRSPEWFSTIHQLLIKPKQILGIAGIDDNFDISVMLTKEFFPEQWDREHATQQWPLETELYLNYYGIVLSAVPLFLYSAAMGWLYRRSMLQLQMPLIPIYILEFQRLFSMMRGTLIPWEFPIYIMQYALVYAICRFAIKRRPMLAAPMMRHGRG
ncbi:hypothetical protein ASG29_14290 [Sphingomonas sp. Leaf412]|uniref:hypothetical protein n=1 Tax=Sphingomonas sp. Leaf412 TaxID=1736370 RepID=UPI0007298A53|nr:hypothetical protein [Sphingomonas sp. Leaf412]KQT31151.1 hypothetical protein ASG29_14290 [Sphingomonas sp. Leaf412]